MASELLMIDGHVHVWGGDALLGAATTSLFTVPEVEASDVSCLEDMRAAGVEHAVLVQPSVYGFDNNYLIGALGRHPDMFTGVALVDPGDPEGPKVLAEIVRRARVTSVRLMPLTVPDRGWFDASAERLWAQAAELDLAVDLLVGPQQLAALGRWLDRYPTVAVIVENLGRPDLSDRPMADAMLDLVRLASRANVHVKLSGTPLCMGPYPNHHTRRWIREAIDAFSPQRVLWGSAYPWGGSVNDLLTRRERYERTMETVRSAAKDLGEAELRQIFGGTARQVYAIDESVNDAV